MGGLKSGHFLLNHLEQVVVIWVRCLRSFAVISQPECEAVSPVLAAFAFHILPVSATEDAPAGEQEKEITD